MLVDLDALPSDFPTHRHEPVFWEKLGRTVATFGFLEEVLGKAIYAFTVKKHSAEAHSDAAFEAWLRNPEGLERALTDPLAGLIDQFERAVQEYSDGGTSEIEDLLDHLSKASRMRKRGDNPTWRSA